MRISILLIATITAPSAALAAELTPEDMAPTVKCYMHSDGLCYEKTEMPDGTLVLRVLAIDREGRPWGGSKVLRPRVSAR